MSDATDHAIRAGILAATERVFGPKMVLRCEPTWMTAAVVEVRRRLPTTPDELSDVALGVLADEFRRRLKYELIDLGNLIAKIGGNRVPADVPDAIAEWSEVLDRISTALYHWVEDGDVLMGLHFISMTGEQWSDIVEAARDAEEESYHDD